MKLRKLLPIATIASVATIVTPLVTSCSKTFEYTKNYKFVEQKEGKMTEDVATETYFKDVKDNNKIFVDDFIKTFLGEWQEGMKAKLWVNNVNVEKATISAGMEGKFQNQEGKFEFKNIPLKVIWNTVTEVGPACWIVTCAKSIEELQLDKNWSLTTETPSVDKPTVINWESSVDEIMLVSFMFYFPSYYLGNVERI